MTSERECYVYIVPPGQITFVTAGRFRVVTRDDDAAVGSFVYGRRYLERADAVMVAVERRDLALACGPAGRFANRNNIIAGHGRFLLGEEEATTIFDAVAQRVTNQWRPVMRPGGVSEADCEAIARAFNYEGLRYALPGAGGGTGV